MTTATTIHARDFTPADVATVLEQEAAIFPLSAPLPSRTVQAWTSGACAPFSRIFTTPDQNGNGDLVVGNLLCIPIPERAWHQLLAGKLVEGDLVGADRVWDGGRASGDRIGIHVYHIEVTDRLAWKRAGDGVVGRAAREVGLAVDKVRKEVCPELEVVGFSALAVSEGGIRTMFNYYNMREFPYYPVSSDYVVTDPKTGKVTAMETIDTQERMNEVITANDGRVPLRIKMACVLPEWPSVLWKYTQARPSSTRKAQL
ncbi:hypothetical protein BCR44DRAFT_55500 [Catenaria anguillulae PL171]|uniref:Uncharacterized protein n=1 Tax=Catenaria anguillulae PL171 TaxID=765915 RepID=A0A1Y2H792_9FUNG|nr:hypothetical protein BCR44DRAFT_55500 [Catenaria anguillulae PL171]